MKASSFLAVAGLAALALSGCGEKSSSTGAAATNASSGNPLNAPADYLRGLNKAQQSAVKTVDTSSLNQAIQLFNVEKGRNPTDLNELVQQKFIPQIPAAPYGSKLVYDSVSGKVSVVKE
jgi:hypothetical protein